MFMESNEPYERAWAYGAIGAGVGAGLAGLGQLGMKENIIHARKKKDNLKSQISTGLANGMSGNEQAKLEEQLAKAAGKSQKAKKQYKSVYGSGKKKAMVYGGGVLAGSITGGITGYNIE